MTNLFGTFAYQITFENFESATAPAQSVTIANNLDANLDWTTFQLTGIGFGDRDITIPAGSQHFQTSVSMSYNGQTFDVVMEAGIHSATGQVYASFQSIDPGTDLPPASVLTGFLPPEDGSGRGLGYLNYSVSPKSTVPTGVVIPNVAQISFDGTTPIATNLVDEHNPALGINPAKEARVTIDANVPVSQVSVLPAYVPASFTVSWAGTGGSGGSGIATYTVHVSNDGGTTYLPWLIDTPLTSATFMGVGGSNYLFYVVAKSNVGNVQTTNLQSAAVPAQSLSALNYWRWQNFAIPTNSGIAADTAVPDNDGVANLIKYALVIAPGTQGASQMPPPQVVEYAEGKRLTLGFLRDPNRNDVTIEVQIADELPGPWVTIASSVNGAPFTGAGLVEETDAVGGHKAVKVRDGVNIDSSGRRFMRITISH